MCFYILLSEGKNIFAFTKCVSPEHAHSCTVYMVFSFMFIECLYENLEWTDVRKDTWVCMTCISLHECRYSNYGLCSTKDR